MKGKFDAYVLWPLAQKFQNWIVDRSTARNFAAFIFSTNFLKAYFIYFKGFYLKILPLCKISIQE